MPEITNFEARDLIERTFNDFTIFLARTRNSIHGRRMPYALSTLLLDTKDWHDTNTPETRDALFKDLSAEGYNYLLKQCFELADIYRLSTKNMLQGAHVLEKAPPEAGSRGKTLKKLIAQVRKFGDEELNKRLAEVESGQRRIVFEEMEDGREGHTVFENGKITYRLNKKYEKASNERNLLRASIILTHELQRNPETGDLKGETAEIVMRDMAFVERLASTHGKKVYEQIPEFGVMHYVDKLFGEESLKDFVGVAFSHAGSYWELTEHGDLNDNGTNEISDKEGNVLYSGSGGRQKTLETWLGLTAAEVWQHLLQPAGYTHRMEGGRFTWINTPGIPRTVIDRAYTSGILTDEMYAKITRGRNSQTLEVPDGLSGVQRENAQGLLGLIQQGMQAEVQQQIFITNAILNWPWVQWIMDKLERLGSRAVEEESVDAPIPSEPRLLNWPVASGGISSPWGERDPPPVEGVGPFHGGIDLAVPTGTPVVATGDGTVVQVVYHFGLGNTVVISMDNGLTTAAMHLSSINVAVNQTVLAGQQIGLSGETGTWTNGAHLHFVVWAQGTTIPNFANTGGDPRLTINPITVLPPR